MVNVISAMVCGKIFSIVSLSVHFVTFFLFCSFSIQIKMTSWELNDVFLLISNVLEENDLHCLWKAEMNSAVDQLIVKRVSLLSSDVLIKHEQYIFDYDINGSKESEEYVREHKLYLEVNRKVGPEKEIVDSESNEDLDLNLPEKQSTSEENEDLKHANIESNETLVLPLDSSTMMDSSAMINDKTYFDWNRNEGPEVDGCESNGKLKKNLPEKQMNDFGANVKGFNESLNSITLNVPQDLETMVNDITFHEPITKKKRAYEKKDKLHDSPIKQKLNIKKSTKKELVKCNYCDREFTKHKWAIKHETKVHVEKSKKDLVKCNYCDKEFTSTKYALRHETKIHIEKSMPTCKLCCRTFQTLKFAIEHCQEVHGQITLMTDVEPVADLEKFRRDNFKGTSAGSQKSGPSISNCTKNEKDSYVENEKNESNCPICQLTIATGPRQLGEFRKHILNHFNKEIVCSICGKEFFSHSIMESHIKDHMNKDPSNIDRFFKCTFCTWVDFSADKLAYHEEKNHNLEILLPRSFVCHCSKAFTSQSTLDWHILIKHIKYQRTKKEMETIQKKKKKISCEICGKIYTLGALKVHVKEHNGVVKKKEKCTCKDCGKTFVGNSSLKEHRLSAHLKIERKCPLCEKVFLNHKGLHLHMTQTHSDLRHSCEICGKSYSHFVNLKVHISRIHNGTPAKKYKCSFCPKEFNRPSLKSMHELKHTPSSAVL